MMRYRESIFFLLRFYLLSSSPHSCFASSDLQGTPVLPRIWNHVTNHINEDSRRPWSSIYLEETLSHFERSGREWNSEAVDRLLSVPSPLQERRENVCNQTVFDSVRLHICQTEEK
jgi:hypothetical protein